MSEVKSMNKTIGLILSTLFILEIFLIGIPLTTTTAFTPPSNGQSAIYFLPQYNVTIVLLNLNGKQITNVTAMEYDAQQFLTWLRYNFTISNTTFGGSMSNTFGTEVIPDNNSLKAVYYLSGIDSLMLIVGVEGSAATSKVPITIEDIVQALGITNIGVVYNYSYSPVSAIAPLNMIPIANFTVISPPYYIPVSKANITITTSSGEQQTIPVINIFENPVSYLRVIGGYEITVQGSILPFTADPPIPGSTFGPVVIFAPFYIVNIFNPMQQNGYLGSYLQSVASTHPVGWGRSLINVTMFDPFVSTGTDDISFQLTYSTSGPMQINLAEMAYIASIVNFPRTMTYQSYKFYADGIGYYSIIGVISTSNPLEISVNGGQLTNINPSTMTNPAGVTYTEVNPSGELSIAGENYYVYLFVILSTSNTPSGMQNGTIIESFTDLEVAIPLANMFLGPFIFTNPVTGLPNLPVYLVSASPKAMIQVSGNNYYNPTTGLPTLFKTVTIKVSPSPTLITTTTTVSLSANAYEEIPNMPVVNHMITSGILTTPPAEIALTGQSSATLAGNYSSSAQASVTYFTNLTVNLNDLPLVSFATYPFYLSFAGVVVTPEYPIINGTTAMQYIASANYWYSAPEYMISIVSTQAIMQIQSPSNLFVVTSIPCIFEVLENPQPSGHTLNIVPLEIQFMPPPGLAYVLMVELGLWGNQTLVTVLAYEVKNNVFSLDYGYFYGIVIPPSISLIPSTPTYTNFICDNSPTVQIYDPDAVLVPGFVTGAFTAISSVVTWPGFPQGAIITYSNIKKTTYTLPPNTYTVEETNSGLQVSINGGPFQSVLGIMYGVPTYLGVYADNNPTVNFLFEQASLPVSVLENMDGLTVIYAPFVDSAYYNYTGYMLLLPTSGTTSAEPYYDISAPVTYQIYNGNNEGIYTSPNTVLVITPNTSFVGATVNYVYSSTDFAVYWYFMQNRLYQVQTSVVVPNVTAKLYFAYNVTPLFLLSVPLYYVEPYYGVPGPSYLALGTNGTMVWVPYAKVYGDVATAQHLATMIYVNLTLQNGTKYRIVLGANNITTLFQQGQAQALKNCNGTYEYVVSLTGLEKLLHVSVLQLNCSTLTVAVYDYVTHETLVATTKLCALSTMIPIAVQPGEIFYFLTFKASTVSLTASTPWFIANSMYTNPSLKVSDKQYAASNPTNVLTLTVTNITVVHGTYKAMIYYNATAGVTVVENAYGVTSNVSGNQLPTIVETGANSTIFEGSLPFTVEPNSTVITVTQNGINIFTNGTLALQLANGQTVSLGPAGYFVLPFVTFNGTRLGYNATVYVTLTDGITSLTLKTYIIPANITPIRLAPIPTIPPMPNAPLANYYYSKPVTITPTNPVINIYATSVIPYPYEFFILAVVRPGANASISAPVVYYSYQAVVAKPALGSSAVPYLLVAVQMNGIASLPPGTYTVTMYAVPFATGPAISEYPVNLIFTNVTIQ